LFRPIQFFDLKIDWHFQPIFVMKVRISSIIGIYKFVPK
jgi:hypothetical protein